MLHSKKLLAVFLSLLILLDSPAMSLTAAAPDTSDTAQSTTIPDTLPYDPDPSTELSVSPANQETETNTPALAFYYLKTIPDTYSSGDILADDTTALSKEFPAFVTAGDTFYITLLSPDNQSLTELGINQDQISLTADNAQITPVSSENDSGFFAAVTPKEEGSLHIEAFLNSPEAQDSTLLTALNLTVTTADKPATDTTQDNATPDDTTQDNTTPDDAAQDDTTQDNTIPDDTISTDSLPIPDTDTEPLPSERIISENFKLNKSQYAMNAGDTLHLYVSISPVLADNVTWSCDSPEIASVDKDGDVTALKKGTAVITASMPVAEQGSITTYEASCTITVSNSMFFSKTAYTLNAGKTLQLDLITIPDDASVTYESSNTSIATVSSTGLVTARSGGATGKSTAVITASSKNGAAPVTCTITVNNTISLSKKTYTIYTGTKQSYILEATAAPKGAVTWKSSDKKIAVVDSKGKITPKKTGKITITATAGGASASCIVTVKKPSLSLTSKKTIYLKNPVTLKAKAAPSGKITWKSSNKKIATISSSGKISPKKTGTVTISATCNGITKKCKITVKKPAITASMSTLYVFEGNESQLSASSRPNTKITWKSSNKKVVTVDKTGHISGIKSGTATVTASIPGASTKVKVVILKNTCKLNLTKQTLMTGTSTYLYMNGVGSSTPVYFEPGDYSSDAVSLSVSGNKCKITAKKPGKTTVSAYFYTVVDGQTIGCRRNCTITVIDNGIKQQQFSLAVKAKKQLSLKNITKEGTSVTTTRWTSSNPKIANINASTGLVTARKTGSVKITAKVEYADRTTKSFSTSIKVSNPKLKSSYTVIAAGNSSRIKLTGTNTYSKISWKSQKSSLVTVAPDGSITSAYGKTGKTTVTATVDGKVLKHQVILTNPGLKSQYKVMAPGTTTAIRLSKINAKSKISYKSNNTGIASVNKKGIVTAKNCGSADITITADGKKFVFQVNVAPQEAINACNAGYSIMYSSTYSQAFRMSSGYYDCSSLVFRAYGCNTGMLGGSVSWAPTAASMAAYLESTGKIISYGPLDVSQLRPGDLLFYSGDYNGRYRNINHVSMYYGGGYRLEKPLRGYYPASNTVMVARPIP